MYSSPMDMDDYIYDDDGNPVLQRSTTSDTDDETWAGEDDNTDIFHMKTDGYDVTLSLARGLITWTNVNPSGGKKKGIFKGKSKAMDQQTIMLRDVFGIKMKRRKATNPDEEGICLGFTLHVTEIFAPNTLSERQLLFEHPSEALCAMYIRKVQMFIAELPNRPKYVKLLLQPYAGVKNGISVYKNKVLPLFNSADINVDYLEIQHNEHVKQEMVHVNLHDFDCIVAMGGDGTVNKVVDGLLTHSQKDRDIEQKAGFTPTKSSLPLGIIPIGSTDHIAQSVMGCDDILSACLCIIMGRTAPIDVCSMYKDDKFEQWCFNCQYGFAGNILQLRQRYKAVGKRGLEPAFIKALTKSKLRSYKCDIEYIPSTPLSVNRKFIPCYRGCDVCWDEKISDEDEVTSDLVQPFDPLAESGNSDTLVDLANHDDNPWHTVKGDYFNVSLFANACRSDIAPMGLSKYSHLNDGVMDLVLVKATERKEFIRFLKRLGNTKNQFDFPFVEVLRVKEVRFRLCLPIGFHYNDYNYSEIDYEMARREKKISASKSTEIIDLDECSDEDFESTPVSSHTPPVQSKNRNKPQMKRANTVQSIQVANSTSTKNKVFKHRNTEPSMRVDTCSSDDSDSDDDDDDEEGDNQSSGSGDIVTINSNGVKTVRSMSAPPQNLVGPAYRMTFAEKDRAKRRKRAQKKEEKKRVKEQAKMKSVWNIDNEMRTEDKLDFRIHHGLLKVYGQGVSPESVFNDATLLCVPRLPV